MYEIALCLARHAKFARFRIYRTKKKKKGGKRLNKKKKREIFCRSEQLTRAVREKLSSISARYPGHEIRATSTARPYHRHRSPVDTRLGDVRGFGNTPLRCFPSLPRHLSENVSTRILSSVKSCRATVIKSCWIGFLRNLQREI